ncbi:MAG: protein-L-isoaspartate(D-aspartate) O-methyltransferase [Sedimentisphaerales bacterium]|nr:protein-L-isoaspartate(D-aspartate) O-methyltransferase [Sedimentisphaerales bacterium]
MAGSQDQDGIARDKHRMLTRDLAGRDITDPDVLRVMAEVPRERFVPPEYRAQAYQDGPLPIGAGQTISQPYIVALMTQLLRLEPQHNVLEIGTGCGYQTAILARLVARVFTIEAVAELSISARDVLAELGVDNVAFEVGDGSCGWPATERTSGFDRIIVTAAVPDLPPPLWVQLAEGGLMVAPVGSGSAQALVLAEKFRGKPVERHICGCRFVKLVGRYGFRGSS